MKVRLIKESTASIYSSYYVNAPKPSFSKYF